MKNILKFLPKNIKNKIRTLYNFFEKYFRILKRKLLKGLRVVYRKKYLKSQTFVIVCVKRVEYLTLAINNINSLHMINPTHKFIINCDSLCFDSFKKIKKKLDYPEMVKVENKFDKGDKPWQYYKIKSVIEASQKGFFHTDADGYWHDEPEIDLEKICILTKAYKVKNNKSESSLVKNFLHKEKWLDFDHYVTGFLYIPNKFMTTKVQKELFDVWQDIFACDIDELSEDQVKNIKRISEELAVNFILQDNFSSSEIRVLKEEDGLDNRNLLESYYYGCGKGILD